MRPATAFTVLIVVTALFASTGCGRKGPPVMPKQPEQSQTDKAK
ncbi:MAG: lipoprotein [Nitrospinae bacterium]|nr:lipoprotein [Nitrospinota bacterium]